MIILASLIGGTVIGLLRGSGPQGRRLFLMVWFAVFAAQTILLLATNDDPRDRSTGEWNLGYFPFALTVLAVGIGVLYASAALGRRRTPASDVPSDSSTT